MGRSVPGTPAAPDLATEVADLLHQVNHAIRRQSGLESVSSGVSSAQMRAMRVLMRGGEPMRMSELADALGIARRSATSVIDELVHLGLVERVDDPTDRRVVDIRLTRAGRKVMADARRRRRSAASAILGRLGEHDLASLRVLLQGLVAD